MDWLPSVIATNTVMPISDIIIRLALASACGAALGFDREVNERPAGLRTHMLTALASAVFTIVTFEIVSHAGDMDSTRTDPIRIIEAVTTGVAFLAAGAIIQAGPGVVKGLTTGAGLWTTGALGVASGAGYYVIAIIGIFYGVVILVGLRWFERHILSTKQQRQSHDPTSSDG